MKITDLTHTIHEKMQVYPGTLPPKLTQACTLEKEGFKEKKLEMFSHTGTHLDCAGHIFEEGFTADTTEVERFFGSAFVIDCSGFNEGEAIGKEWIENYSDKIKMVDFLLIYTGWEKKWGTDDYFGAFPVLSETAVDYILQYNIKGIGLDTISIEPVSSVDLEIHHKVLGSDVVIVENLKNLQNLIGKEFYFSCLPLNIKNGDGSPIRAIGIEL